MSDLNPPADTSIQPGDRVRSYDFPDSHRHGPDSEAPCFVEGTVERITEQKGTCKRYRIVVDRQVVEGEELDEPRQETVLPPVNGIPNVGPGADVTHGVEKLEDGDPDGSRFQDLALLHQGRVAYTHGPDGRLPGTDAEATLALLLIREAWNRGMDVEDLADGYGPGEGTHGDWSGIRDSSDAALEAMLERALNFHFGQE